MAPGVSVFCFERLDQCLHAFQEQLFDTPCLLVHQISKVLLIETVLQQQPSLVQCLLGSGPNLLDLEWLQDVVESTQFETGYRHIHLCNAGDHHHGHFGPLRSNAAQEGQTVHLRHPDVGDHQRHLCLLQNPERLDARSGNQHIVSRHLQYPA